MLARVPQGEPWPILGPVLLIFFVNDVFQLSSKNHEVFLYADDAAIVFTCDNEAKLQMHIEMFFVQQSVNVNNVMSSTSRISQKWAQNMWWF